MWQSSRFAPVTGHAFAAAALGLACSQGIHAAGFALIEQGVAGMGTAYAGAAATADTVDTLYFNPAGMTRLPGTQAGAAIHLVLPQTKFNNTGTRFSPLVGGAPIPGSDGGDAGGLAVVPHGYLSHQFNERTWLGLAINVPFGLATEYDSDWVGRYHAIKSEV
ncbi:MAG: outer membrane protein transport protein, partial [Chromatiaceae bacterium]|nr:outer membrane protein transport protein [Chromatiaceae bacterium]